MTRTAPLPLPHFVKFGSAIGLRVVQRSGSDQISREEIDEAAGSCNGSRPATRQRQTRHVWHLKARFGLRVVSAVAAFGAEQRSEWWQREARFGLRVVKRSDSVRSEAAFGAVAALHSGW